VTGRWNIAMSRSALARLVIAALPLPGLLAAPARAETEQAISVCSGTATKVIILPAGEVPPAPSQDRKDGCAHFTCPRDRGDDDPSDQEDC
jgi:hypothetical protein